MIDGLPVSLDVLAPSALVGLFVLLVFVGKLVPKATVDRMIAEHQKQVEDIAHDRDEWRAAHRISEAGRQELRDHNVALTNDIAKPLTGFLQAFRQVSGSSEVNHE